jgi:hypothetical protein
MTMRNQLVRLIAALAFSALNAPMVLADPILGEIGDRVWEDLNANGIQESGEAGIAGVTVTLLGDDGTGAFSTTLDSTVTDAAGNYLFSELEAGTYAVGFEALTSDWLFTPRQVGADPALDSDGPTSDPILLASDESNLTIDAGLYMLASITGVKFEDLNGDGAQNAAEPGIDGVTIELLDALAQTVATTSTDANGSFWFTDLTPGVYTVREIVPDGSEATTPTERTVTLQSGQELDGQNFGNRTVPVPSAVSLLAIGLVGIGYQRYMRTRTA